MLHSYSRTSVLHAGHFSNYINLAIALRSSGDVSSCYSRARFISSVDPDLYLNQAVYVALMTGTGGLSSELRSFVRATALDTTDSDGYLFVGHAHSESEMGESNSASASQSYVRSWWLKQSWRG